MKLKKSWRKIEKKKKIRKKCFPAFILIQHLNIKPVILAEGKKVKVKKTKRKGKGKEAATLNTQSASTYFPHTAALPSCPSLLLALVWRVSADRVVPYEFGLGRRGLVLGTACQWVNGRVLCRGGGGRVAEGAGPAPETLLPSVAVRRGGVRRGRQGGVEALQVSC